jgi:GTPase
MGIDYVDDMIRNNVTRAMATAARTLRGAVGDDVLDLLPGDERVAELILIYTDDLYSVRGVGDKVSAATRKLVHTMEWQLKLELRRAREARA